MSDTWTPLKLLAWSQEWFAKKGVDAPRLTGELLLAHALRCDRVRLYLDFDKPLGDVELGAFRELVKRRADGEPTAWLVGKREFWGRPFRVTPDVLVPRPETELLVEAALATLPDGGSALDLCTGSGAIGISLALERPGARVAATDLSSAALAVARENATALGATIELLEGNLFAALPAARRFDLIVSNPPYVPEAEYRALEANVRDYEPRLALHGGDDGLEAYVRLVPAAATHLRPGGVLAVEVGAGQAAEVRALFAAAGAFDPARERADLAGIARVVFARLSTRDRGE